MPQEIDYTTWRKGKKVSKSEKIAVCPQCGKKGSYRPGYTDSKGRYQRARYIHTGLYVELWGLPMFEIKAHCMIDEREASK